MGGLALNPAEARTAAAIFERMFPAGEDGPGAAEIGTAEYLDRALAGEYAEHAAMYRVGLAALDRAAREAHGAAFAACRPQAQDALLTRLEADDLSGWAAPRPR